MALPHRVLVANSSRHLRTLVSDILRSSGCRDIVHAANGAELLAETDQSRPRIVVTAADLPGLSGLDFAKRVRAGFNFVRRETSIILTTGTPTRSFLEATRAVGIDEVVAVPFTTQTLAARIRSVIDRPRSFVDCPSYVGPCRRRVMLQDYKGPKVRAADPAETTHDGDLWAAETNRSAVRLCVQKMSEFRSQLAPEHFQKLRTVYQSVMKLETLASQTDNHSLVEAAKSFGRHLTSVGAQGAPDQRILEAHIEALHSMVTRPELAADECRHLVEGLQITV
jgi:two-component system, chemotaxis family, chemotaxis protein CheY